MNKCKMIKRWILVCKDGREFIFSDEKSFKRASLEEYPQKNSRHRVNQK